MGTVEDVTTTSEGLRCRLAYTFCKLRPTLLHISIAVDRMPTTKADKLLQRYNRARHPKILG